MPIAVHILVYPEFELLDATGPASVFSTANFILNRRERPTAYEVALVSASGGLVRSSSGVAVDTRPLSRTPPKSLHTFLISGGEAPAIRNALVDAALRERAPRWARKAARYGSVCAGSFILADFGLVDGRRVAAQIEQCCLRLRDASRGLQEAADPKARTRAHARRALDAWLALPRTIELPVPPAGAPNVLLVLLDDVGFGQTSTFGGPASTPNQLLRLIGTGWVVRPSP